MLVSIVRPAVALAVLSLFFVSSCSNAATAAVAPSAPPPALHVAIPTIEGQLSVLSIRVGLDAESIAAAGVAPGSVASVIAALGAAHNSLSTPLALLDTNYTAARSAVNAAQRKIQGGTATPEEVAAFPSLEQALANAESARTAALDSLFASATSGLTAAQRTSLTSIRSNRSWKLPVEFLVVTREEAEWVALRDALSNERLAAKNGEQPNATCQQLLGTARANASVAAARTALDTSLTTVTSAWTTATEG